MKTSINQIMKCLLLSLVTLSPLFVKAEVLYPGQTIAISFEPTTGEYGPIWTTDNPTLQLSGTGFRCNVTAQAYFGGSATVICTYNDRIGSTTYTRTRRWSFSCIDTQISITPTSNSIRIGETFQISCGYNRTTYITPSVQFTGYDNSIVDVSGSGIVTAKSKGMTKVYVKSNLGTNTAVCTVNVLDTNSNGNISSAQSAYDNWDSSKTKTIELNEAGTLSDYITDANKYSITDLTIIGPMNGSDLRLLRDMAGCDHNRKTTSGKLESLDLKNAYFVAGGKWYIELFDEYHYTSDTQDMPIYSFRFCRNLKRIRFPKYCTTISNGGTLQCYGLEHIAIPSGVTTIDGECLTGGYEDLAIQTLTLPSTITEVVAPYQCEYLTDVYCYATTPPAVYSEKSFKSGANFPNGVLYVPKGCAQNYWKAEGWRIFGDIKETLDVFNTLYINVGDNGVVKYNGEVIEVRQSIAYTGKQAFEVLNGEDVIVEVVPKEGFYISRMTLDGQPIDIPTGTEIFNLGKLSKHSQLSVQFSQQVLITNIKLPASLILKKDEVKTLSAAITPENATNNSLTWESSDEDVVVVDHTGKLIGINPGIAYITVIANDGSGVTASCKITVEDLLLEKCATPTLSYINGRISLFCETEEVKFITEILADNAHTYEDDEFEFAATYQVQTYATKYLFENSDTLCVALCWIQCDEDHENVSGENILNVHATPILIQGQNGVLSFCGLSKGWQVAVYDVNGSELAAATALDKMLSLATNLSKGEVAIVKIDSHSLKIIMH